MVFLRIRNSDITSAAFRRDPNGHVTQLTRYSLDADTLSVSPAASGPSKDLVVFETFGHGAPDGVAAAVATVPATCASRARCAGRVRFLTPRRSLPDQHFNPAWAPDGQADRFRAVLVRRPRPGGRRHLADGHGTARIKRPVSTSPLFEFRPAWGASRLATPEG